MQKNTWKKPKLIILLRGQPGEVVLSYCKTNGQPGSPNDAILDCVNSEPGWCATCYDRSAS